MLDIKLRQIVNKSAGIYFLVTDNSQVDEISEESKLRVCFINEDKGPVNSLITFAKGDTTGFKSVFGTSKRTNEKKGNFGIKVCLDALKSGPLAVVNLRNFDDTYDKSSVATINPNYTMGSNVMSDIPYTSLFDKNGFWSPKPSYITNSYFSDKYLNFGNVGVKDLSLFVVKSDLNDIANLTSDGDETLATTALVIDDYPGLNKDMLLKDTFITVYVFEKDFGSDTRTLEELETLMTKYDSGFVTKFVGSLIPNLTTELNEDVSIDTVVNQKFTSIGLIVDINDDLLEREYDPLNPILSLDNFNFSEIDITSITELPALMSYNSIDASFDPIEYTAIPTDLYHFTKTNKTVFTKYLPEIVNKNSFIQNFDSGLRLGDYIIADDGSLTSIDSMEVSSNETYDYIEVPSDCKAIVGTSNNYFYISDEKWLVANVPTLEETTKNWKIIQKDFSTFSPDETETFDLTYHDAIFNNKKVIALASFEALNNHNNILVIYNTVDKSITYKEIEIGLTNPLTKLNKGVGSTLFLYNQYNIFKISTSTFSVQKLDNTNQLNIINYISSIDHPYIAIETNNDCYYSDDLATWSSFFKFSDFSTQPGFNIGSISDLVSTDNKMYFGNMSLDETPIYQLAIINKSDVNFTVGNLPEYSDFELKKYTSPTDTDMVDIYHASNNLISLTNQYSLISGKNSIIAHKKALDGGTIIIYEYDPSLVSISEDFYVIAMPGTSYNYNQVSLVDDKYILMNNTLHLGDIFSSYNDGPVLLEDGTVVTDSSELLALTNTDFNIYYTINTDMMLYHTKTPYKVFDDSSDDYIVKFTPSYEFDPALQPFKLISYKPRNTQFINGTSEFQNEFLDLLTQPWITKGLKDVAGLRYLIDSFKSFPETNYKHQFGILANNLHENNRFVSCIINEPFIEDLVKSTNPLFKNDPSDNIITYQYLPIGGNTKFSSKKLEKFITGVGYCYFFGPGDVINNIVKPLSGIISNKFYEKQYQFDIVANSTGYIEGVTELEEKFSDDDRKYLEKFRYNPIIDFGGMTIFGNLSGQKTVSKQQQIHNVELLCYIKDSLYNMSKSDTFKKPSYSEFIKTQTKVKGFMDSLVLAGAIEANPMVKCDIENNPTEVQNYKIKLVRVEYRPYNCIEKVVFDLNIY